MHVNLIKLKIKSKSLEAEAHIIRKEMKTLLEKGLKNWPDYSDLRDHLKFVVGVEARATFMARAFLRGRPLKDVEKYMYQILINDARGTNLDVYSAEKDFNQKQAIKKALDMVKKYKLDGTEGPKEISDRFEVWLRT